MRTEFPSVYGPVRRLWLREARPQVESRRAGALCRRRFVRRANPFSRAAAARVTRVPAGHPEGYLEGFANLYSDVTLTIEAAREGKPQPEFAEFPTIVDGVKGMAFMEAAVESSRENGK